MNSTTQYIKNRLSLREPLQESLDIVALLADELDLSKDANLTAELEKVTAHHPTCTDFERAFPSLTFAIATGVGKTRLMGACITYLYLAKGIKNFFILAPGSTIYEKLIEDFGSPGFRKYVFKGIAEFVTNPPVIITGENYRQQGNLFEEGEIRINIFNIQKFNRDTKVGRGKKDKDKPPRIKGFSEFLGQSYWQYLMSVNDLVILMDESHRYHANASKKAINELKPILGLEMTATPIAQDDSTFRNVVYEYSLAQALADERYVKVPTIAKRRNYSTKGKSVEEIERTKLEDAVSIHLDTKNALEIYAANNQVKLVKPFILVVCTDINHAQRTFEHINSDAFYDGQFKDKVLQIDSSTKKTEDVERQFLTLEQTDNEIEIVIHVNMLKEGWDVTNLYTIVPLRAANAPVLIEQTIGRGLRLPYNGKRTGEEKIDKLTVVAHDNFEAVLEQANNPESILNKVKFVEIDENDLRRKSVVVTSKPTLEKQMEEEQDAIKDIQEPKKKQDAQNTADAKKALIDALPDLSKDKDIKNINDLNKPEIKKKVIEKVKHNLQKGQQNLFTDEIVKEAGALYESLVNAYKNSIIEIPRIVLKQGKVSARFEHFDLDVSGMNYQVLEEEIVRINLTNQQDIEIIKARSSGASENPLNLIVTEIRSYPEIDYDKNSDLLFHLANQAFEKIKTTIPDDKNLELVVRQFKASIAERIYRQMKAHFSLVQQELAPAQVIPFQKIEAWNFSEHIDYGRKVVSDTIKPVKDIPKYIFGGFLKAGHRAYKFDSKPEKDLAYVLENDKSVLKWLRPAPKQFRIYWDNNSKRYEPDFVVETKDKIHMLEVKRADQLNDHDVLEKKAQAEKYCQQATDYNVANGGKSWTYAIIPHDKINTTFNLQYILSISS